MFVLAHVAVIGKPVESDEEECVTVVWVVNYVHILIVNQKSILFY